MLSKETELVLEIFARGLGGTGSGQTREPLLDLKFFAVVGLLERKQV